MLTEDRSNSKASPSENILCAPSTASKVWSILNHIGWKALIDYGNDNLSVANGFHVPSLCLIYVLYCSKATVPRRDLIREISCILLPAWDWNVYTWIMYLEHTHIVNSRRINKQEQAWGRELKLLSADINYMLCTRHWITCVWEGYMERESKEEPGTVPILKDLSV